MLGGADATGDEGGVFAHTLDEGPLDQSTLSSLRRENDHGLVLVDGRLIEVEFRSKSRVTRSLHVFACHTLLNFLSMSVLFVHASARDINA